MGGGASKKNDAKENGQKNAGEGAAASAKHSSMKEKLATQPANGKPVATSLKPTDLPEGNRWHKDQQYDDENSLIYSGNTDYQELRNILGEPLGQRFLGDFAKGENSHENFFAWIDVQEYRSIPTPDFRRCQARQIYKKYIRPGGVMQLGGLTEKMIAEYHEKIHGENQHLLDDSTFVSLQHLCFREMTTNTFARFKNSDKYKEYKEVRKKVYNRLNEEDFRYMEYLGGGAFGKVVRVVKISTGREYAMKVVSKAKMLEQLGHKDSKTKYERLNIERNVYVNSSFPFIIDMDYAFQTETEVMLVMEYARGGTLRDLVHTYDDKRLPEPEARFVICQTMLALRHLHYMNYVYRDLKPINVLINGRGHVKLGDMGLVARIDETFKPVKDKKKRLHRAESRLDGAHPEGYDERPTGRRFTIVGTSGYKAPEMLQAKRSEKNGYGASVDWWSLGVMSFELIAGTNPFAPKMKNLLVDHGEKSELDSILSVKDPLKQLPNSVASALSDPCKAFLSDLLQIDPHKRLGTDKDGVRGIRSHPFFQCYDFEKMLGMEIDPPYKAKKKHRAEKPHWKNFKIMMNDLETADLSSLLGANNDNKVKERHQRYFKNWDYVAQATFKLELGLQQRKVERVMTLKMDNDSSAKLRSKLSKMVAQNEEAEAEEEKKNESKPKANDDKPAEQESVAQTESKQEEGGDAVAPESKQEDAGEPSKSKQEEAGEAAAPESKEAESVDPVASEPKQEGTFMTESKEAESDPVSATNEPAESKQVEEAPAPEAGSADNDAAETNAAEFAAAAPQGEQDTETEQQQVENPAAEAANDVQAEQQPTEQTTN